MRYCKNGSSRLSYYFFKLDRPMETNSYGEILKTTLDNMFLYSLLHIICGVLLERVRHPDFIIFQTLSVLREVIIVIHL